MDIKEEIIDIKFHDEILTLHAILIPVRNAWRLRLTKIGTMEEMIAFQCEPNITFDDIVKIMSEAPPICSFHAMKKHVRFDYTMDGREYSINFAERFC